MRSLLNYFNINENISDLILLKFVENETSSIYFFNKITSFLEVNSFLDESKNLQGGNASHYATKIFPNPKPDAPEEAVNGEEAMMHKDSVDELAVVLDKYETKKSISSALNVCKKFDRDSTGRINTVDFVNILWHNLEFSKFPESESLLLKYQNEMLIEKDMKTIEYSELFDKFDNVRASKIIKGTTEIFDRQDQEITLTNIIQKISHRLKNSSFNLEKSFSFFDRDNIGLIVSEDFRKILRWMKVELSEEEVLVLEDNLISESAINYKKFTDLIEINDKFINVQFDPEIWYAISKSISFDLYSKLYQNHEFIRYSLKQHHTTNPLISASIIEDILLDLKWEFKNEEIQKILKYAVVGSIHKLAHALQKLEKTNLDWKFEYVHAEHFLRSIPVIFNRKKELPENKDVKISTNKDDTEGEKLHIISKVKAMLKERGVTMWESLLSCSITIIEGSKISKNDFLRMIKIMDLDLTMKEKALILDVLDKSDKGKIDLHIILKTFENTDVSKQKGTGKDMLLEKMIYGMYYGGYSIGLAFNVIDQEKTGSITQKEFRHGMGLLNLGLSNFEINQILEMLDFSNDYIRITRYDFKKTLKKLMKRYRINPMKNFSISLLARIKHLIQKKNKNLLENFIEEDLHKTGYADLELLKKALIKFGLNNIKIHEIKTLVKMFKSEVNLAEDDNDEDFEEESEDGKQNNDTLSLGGEFDMPLPGVEKKKKKFDIKDPNFRINYQEFVNKIYAEVDTNTKLVIQSANHVLRKVYNMTRIKELTIFEAFVYFDVNNQNMISNMELRIGLQNLEITLEKYEMNYLWGVLEKNKTNKVTYSAFFNGLLNSG